MNRAFINRNIFRCCCCIEPLCKGTVFRKLSMFLSFLVVEMAMEVFNTQQAYTSVNTKILVDHYSKHFELQAHLDPYSKSHGQHHWHYFFNWNQMKIPYNIPHLPCFHRVWPYKVMVCMYFKGGHLGQALKNHKFWNMTILYLTLGQ